MGVICWGKIAGVVCSATILFSTVAVARDATWRDCELGRQDPDRSIAACSKLLAYGPARTHAEAFHNRGLAFAAKGNLDQAIADVSAGIRLDPQRAYRWQERGELYTRQEKYQQGVADITEAIRLDVIPRTFRFHSRAQAYRGLGDLTHAIADFDQAIRLDPVARLFRFYERGNALRDSGQYDRALADYEIALKLEPMNAWTLVERGRTYAKMGRPQAAKSDFEAARSLGPPTDDLQRALQVELAALTIIPSTVVPPPSKPSIAPPPMPKAVTAPEEQRREISSGSAIVVSQQGHLLTNYHVVSECTQIAVAGVGTAAMIAKDAGNDLALIQAKTLPDYRGQPLKVRNNSVRLGEDVVTLGYPLRGLLGEGLNVTTGTISALNGIGNDSTKLQFTAAIQPGNSGGALVDRAGAFVGVVTSRLSDVAALKVGGFVPQGINFAVRKEIVIAFLAAQWVTLEPVEDGATVKAVTDIAEQARNSVFPISCSK